MALMGGAAGREWEGAERRWTLRGGGRGGGR